ncbi:MAG: hypothetical protein QXV60_00650 [Nitrososphaerota archaeon]
MLSWLSNWWSAGTFSGPARNAPNQGKNIKSLFDQRPKHVIIVSDTEIKKALSNLKKTEVNQNSKDYENPLFKELYKIFEKGYKEYFKANFNCVNRNTSVNIENRSYDEKIKARDRVLEIIKKKKQELEELKKQSSIPTLEDLKKRSSERSERKK